MNYKILASLVSLNIVCPMALLGWTDLENAEADGAKMKMFNPITNDPNLEESDTAACTRLQIEGMRERGELK